jgi:hypothetical protein
MKRLWITVATSILVAPAALAQEHYTEGPVWECSSYRTKPGHFDDYMEYLRRNVLPQNEQSKKAGLVLDQKIYTHVPQGPDDPDIVFCTLHSSYAKALDYSAETDKKAKELAAKHYKTGDEKKQREMTAPRYEWREFLGTRYYREITLKALP